jgi:hypothetical protein
MFSRIKKGFSSIRKSSTDSEKHEDKSEEKEKEKRSSRG